MSQSYQQQPSDEILEALIQRTILKAVPTYERDCLQTRILKQNMRDILRRDIGKIIEHAKRLSTVSDLDERNEEGGKEREQS